LISFKIPPTSVAKPRIERVIGQVFSLAATIMSIAQVFLVAIPHAKFGNSNIMFASLGLIILCQLVAVFSFWFGSADRRVYFLNGFAYVVAFLLYPISMTDVTELPSDYRSWLWWWTGTATIAMTMFLPRWWSFAYLIFVPISYFFLRLQLIGGAEDVGSALLDATYIVLYAMAIQALVGLLRTAAVDVDARNDALAEIAVKRAQIDATELESEFLDELVHDQVLTTLVVAARADSEERKAMAGAVAAQAIERLQQAASGEGVDSNEVSVGAFVESLSATLARVYPDVPVDLTRDRDFNIPISVGIALADATIQAITNSMQHAGLKATRKVRIKVFRQGLKIVVMDNGRGFWESKIPKDRMGIRNSIRRRANLVGAEVRIKSAPRKGTSVVLLWGPNA
jgi:signal transduction histidine kinase